MNLAPFDQNDPFNRLADKLRREVAELASKAIRTADYRALSPADQLESLMCGILVGLVGVCFAHIEDGGRAAMIQAMADYLPQARAQAEGIIADAMKRRAH